MGISNVSGIGKGFMQEAGQAQAVAGASEDGLVSFADMMAQAPMMSPGGGMPQLGSSSADYVSGSPGSGGSPDYDRLERPRRLDDDAWSQADRYDDGFDAAERVESFEGDVRQVLEDELGVSEEEIDRAMESLGLTFADLLDPAKLALLVGELTGKTDPAMLLCDEAFLNVLNAVGQLGDDLLKELGMTAEEFQQALADALAAPEGDAGAVQAGEADAEADLAAQDANGAVQDAQGALQDGQGALQGEVEVADAGKPAKDAAAAANAAESDGDADAQIAREAGQKEGASESDAPDAPIQAEDEGAQGELSQEDGDAEEDGGKQDGLLAKGAGAQQAKGAVHGQPNAAPGAGAFQEVLVQTADGAQAQEGAQLDVSNIIRQIVEHAKLTVGVAETTLEMQLNPEHLGKVFLQLTSRNGEVTAHIMAQNEAVREALENQVADLRQNMSQAGVKVAAIEVTIASHEFERNLEQEARQDERQAEQQERSMRRGRRIRLGDLDDLSGLMSEEEALVARMMAEQGNSVDYIA